MKLTRGARNGERGQVLPLIAVSIFTLLGMVALSVDVGNWRYQQRVQQSATDSAAIAAGVESDYSTGTTQLADMTTFGRNDAATNGFTNTQNGVSVTINQPPSSGPNVSSPGAVEAIITKPGGTFFSGIFGTPPTIRTRAVAVKTSANTDCVYALNRTGTKNAGLTIDGGSSGFDASTCGIITDSILTVSGSPVIAGKSIGIANYSQSTIGNATYPVATPAPALAVADPCASLPSCAAFTSAVSTSASTIPTTTAPAPVTVAGVTTYYPGVYTSTLTASGTCVFSPGIYVLDTPSGQNSFDASGGGGFDLSGSGVTFYNESGSFYIKGTGSTNVSFTAPSSGPFNGLVFYQPPSNSNQVTWDGNDHLINFSGLVYLPSGNLYLNGSAPSVSEVVANSLEINGQGLTVTGPKPTDPVRGHFVLAE